MRSGLFWAAIAAGTSYCLAAWGGWSGAAAVLWKGAGVTLLALWAAQAARTTEGRVIALVLALGALGDVLLEVAGLTIGALAFLAGHIVAILLYWRARRARLTGSQRLLAVILVAGTPAIAWLLSHDAGVALYALGLGGMAGTAWASYFPRYRVGIGAVLFVVSDLLIFARMGVLAGSIIPTLLVWPLYFAGQVLIAVGVIGRRDTAPPVPQTDIA